MKKNKFRIFISYATEDYEFAKRLYDDLKKIEGITPWLDREDLLVGQKWKETIPQVIKDSLYFLLLISKNSVSKKGYIQNEQKIAIDLLEGYPPDKIFIIPARIDYTEPLYEKLKDIHWADFSFTYEIGFREVERVLYLNSPEKFNCSYETNIKQLFSMIKPIQFVNRFEELQVITHSDDLPYVLLVGPMGYGKTRLLEESKIRLEEQNWLCVQINFSRKKKYNSLDQITNPFSKIIGEDIYKTINLVDPEIAAGEIAIKIDEYSRQKQKKGILVQFDETETIEEKLANELLNQFIPSFADTINNGKHRLKLRFIISGRYNIISWQKFSIIPMKTIVLTPFNFKSVHKTVKNIDLSRGLERDPGYITEFSAWLMSFTGGHPKCMAEIIIKNYGLSMATISKTEEEIYNEIINPVIEDIKIHILSKLENIAGIFQTLSVIRKFNPTMLRYFLDNELIKLSKKDKRQLNEYDLADLLQHTYLVDDKDGFLQDGITRRLLSNELRKYDLGRYIQICERAISFYEDKLEDLKTTNPDMIAVELFFQKMQYVVCWEKDRNLDQYFKYVRSILHKLVSLKKDSIGSLKRLLINDWEFRFTFNYLFNENGYDDDLPFSELIDEIDHFSEDLKMEKNTNA